jgi:hypothetical protein
MPTLPILRINRSFCFSNLAFRRYFQKQILNNPSGREARAFGAIAGRAGSQAAGNALNAPSGDVDYPERVKGDRRVGAAPNGRASCRGWARPRPGALNPRPPILRMRSSRTGERQAMETQRVMACIATRGSPVVRCRYVFRASRTSPRSRSAVWYFAPIAERSPMSRVSACPGCSKESAQTLNSRW